MKVDSRQIIKSREIHGSQKIVLKNNAQISAYAGHGHEYLDGIFYCVI